MENKKKSSSKIGRPSKLKEKLTLQNRRQPLEQVHLMQSWVIALQLAEEHQLNLMEIPQ